MSGPIAGAGEPPRRMCPHARCDGSGWILDADGTAEACECRDRRISRARARNVSSVIPARYRSVSFDAPPISDLQRSPSGRPAVDAARMYLDDLDQSLERGDGFWLMGDVGTGKTSLAMLISRRVLDAGHTVAIYSVPKLLSRIRRTYDGEGDGPSYSQFFSQLTSVDLLHLDDLGAERATDWVLEQLYAIINERYESKRSILVTSNLDQAALEQQLGQRTVSRLVEICGHWIIPLHGQDMRMVG